MSRPVDPYEAFLTELARLELEAEEASAALEEAEETYAPALVPVPLPPMTLEPAPPRTAGILQLLTGQPDRLVTYPIWAAIVVVAYVGLTALYLGALAFATTLLFLLARLLDAPLGVPVLRFAAVCAGILAGAGSFVTLWQSFRKALARCPW